MGSKRALFNIKGMSRDLAASKFSPEFAYENMNLRLVATDDNTSLALTNEKGTAEVNTINWNAENLPPVSETNFIFGTPIGQQVLNDNLILFTAGEENEITLPDYTEDIGDVPDNYPQDPLNITSDTDDNIYKFWFDDSGVLNGRKLFQGDLHFRTTDPIECIGVYENEGIQKVYWTDGINPPRVINAASDAEHITSWDGNAFNFVNNIKLRENVSVTRDIVAAGSFAPGTIQYVFTYYKLYGQETNIFHTSPLLYTSYVDRGASPDDTVSNSFTITLSNLDTRFDYVRIYSVLRTSLDSTPQARQVVDLEIFKDDPSATLTYIDTGIEGSTIDITKLLYIGGEEVVVGTMGQKDNTLFLGDIKYERLIIPEDIQSELKSLLNPEDEDPLVTFDNEAVLDVLGEFGGYYNYTSQLQFDSNHIKGFKYLEWYRFGLQFQFRTGRWSDPVWIGDLYNDRAFPSTTIFNPDSPDEDGYYNDPITVINKTCAKLHLDKEIHSDIFNLFRRLVSLGYVKVRPVIVYPKISDREVICQGILCPTVYNTKDRVENAPFAQASWFARPNAPFEVPSYDQSEGGSYGKLDTHNIPREYYGSYINNENLDTESRGGGIELEKKTMEILLPSDPDYRGDTIDLEFVNLGAWLEFRHNKPLPSTFNRNAEIQSNICIDENNPRIKGMDRYPLTPEFCYAVSSSGRAWAGFFRDIYYVDQSIVTLHSPEVENNNELNTLDFTNLKLRIVGTVPLTAFTSNISVQIENSPIKSYGKLYYEEINSRNASVEGWKALISAPMWFDGSVNPENEPIETPTSTPPPKFKHGDTFYIIYPWNKSGSLSNAAEGKYSKLLHKTLSNTRFSYNTLYYTPEKIWKAEDNTVADRWDSPTTTEHVNRGVTGIQIFDSKEVSFLRLPSQGEGLPDITYYGNIDELITFTSDYPITFSYRAPIQAATYPKEHEAFCKEYSISDDTSTYTTTSNDSISIKYKSTPHLVMALRNTESNLQKVLPTFRDNYITNNQEHPIVNDANYILGNWPIIPGARAGDMKGRYFWNDSRSVMGVYQEVWPLPFDGDRRHCTDPSLSEGNTYATRFGFLWLGEIYNDNVQNRFGGNTPEALVNNQWVSAGKAISFIDNNGILVDDINISWSEGDTYYQRYDCLKTYPFTKEDENSIVEVVSFMCETRINIDGRYDRNRGMNSLYVTPENFNLINPAYSQLNNFFNYRDINFNKLVLNHYPNTLFWSKTKTLGEEVDTWANVTMASSLDLDGDKGTVRAIRRLGDYLFAIQDTGISQILYNDNVQIASTAGVPIEIANSGKVSGKRYISNHIGCTNKWSIYTTNNGMYFIDDITKGIYIFNGQQLTNISDKLGFHSWMTTNFDDIKIWNPENFDSAVTYYDKINQDLFFITKDNCLGFNENLGNFVSFYSYEHTPYFSNLEDRGIMWQRAEGETRYRPWMYREGEYNKFFNSYKPYWTTVVVNSEPTVDKIFNNLEFRADSFDEDTYVPEHTFDRLTVWNEYQKGIAELKNKKDRVSNLQKKFRIWRAIIPRNTENKGTSSGKNYSRDRMRNPWLYLKLSAEKEDSINRGYKTVLHDLAVDYFE